MIHILEKGEKADPLWGMDTEIITDEMIEALQQGKRLYLSVNDEYAVVIKRKTDKLETIDTDTISRQQAIEHLKKRLYESALNNDGVASYTFGEIADNRIEIWLNEVSSSPTIEPDTDTISRQKVLDALKKLCDECDSLYCGDCRMSQALPKNAFTIIESEIPQ